MDFREIKKLSDELFLLSTIAISLYNTEGRPGLPPFCPEVQSQLEDAMENLSNRIITVLVAE